MSMEILLADTPIMFALSTNGVAGAVKAFDLLESKLPSLKKRKFYGIIENIPPHDTYRAGVAIMEGDDPKALSLNTWIVPGGKYARTKIKNWEKKLNQIGPTFKSLMQQYTHDPTRPSIEFYRNMEELFLLLPIK